MLEISTGKVVRVIMLAREYGPDSVKLSDFISGMNDDEKANLVAVMWIGRGSFEAEELEYAITDCSASLLICDEARFNLIAEKFDALHLVGEFRYCNGRRDRGSKFQVIQEDHANVGPSRWWRWSKAPI